MSVIPEIQDLQVNNNPKINEVTLPVIPAWREAPSLGVPTTVPVTLSIGAPIVDIPGCVESRRDDTKSRTLQDDDEKGNIVLCDAGVPSYTPMDYTPEQLIPTNVAEPPPVNSPEEEEVKESPNADVATKSEIPSVPKIPNLPCPRPDDIPVGAKNKAQTKIILRYERTNDGECIAIYKDIPVLDVVGAYLPGAPAVTTTATITLVATSAALTAKPLADLLLKLVKPTVKKVVKKISALRGKKEKVLSRQERLLAQRDRNRALMTLRRALKK